MYYFRFNQARFPLVGLLCVLYSMVGVFVLFQNDAALAQPTLKQMIENEALQKTDVVEKEMEKGIPRDEYNRGTPPTFKHEVHHVLPERLRTVFDSVNTS